MDSTLCFHESTGLVLRHTQNSAFVPFDSLDVVAKGGIMGYALKIIPDSFSQQKRIEQLKGIKVSYIPFGYEPVYIPSGTDINSLSLKKYPDDTKEISTRNVDTKIKLPALYIEWPVELTLPSDMDYEILYAIVSHQNQTREVYPNTYHLVFQTCDTVLSSNIRLKNLKIRISKNGSVLSETLTDAKGHMKITANQALYESEPLTYSITAVLSSPKWTITRECNLATPVHTALGTLSQYFDINNPLDTIYITLSSSTTEYEIHRAIDYYRNNTHELSNTILSSENSLKIAASDSTVSEKAGREVWDVEVPNGATIVIYNNGIGTRNLMGAIFHEIGHARKDYAEGATYINTSEQLLIHESYASFIGYHLSRKYYLDRGYTFLTSGYELFNIQHRQYWSEWPYTSLFVDLTDDYNQGELAYFWVYDTISDVPILSIDRLGVFSHSLSDYVSGCSPLVGEYFRQGQLDTLLVRYYY